MSIATKTGDGGETSLMYGRRVPKNDPRVEAYGAVDELNAALGVARVIAQDSFVRDEIYAIQRELITLMGELATAPEDMERYRRDGFTAMSSQLVDRLSALVDDLEKEKLINYKGWAIPGDTKVGAALDVARTTCRRAERRVAQLATTSTVNPEILRYLNRLSDICWLLERYVAHSAA